MSTLNNKNMYINRNKIIEANSKMNRKFYFKSDLPIPHPNTTCMDFKEDVTLICFTKYSSLYVKLIQ